MNKLQKRILIVLSESLWLYFLLIWLYIAVENLIYPVRVATTNLAEYFPVPQNLLVLAAFAASFVSFIIWRYLKESGQ